MMTMSLAPMPIITTIRTFSTIITLSKTVAFIMPGIGGLLLGLSVFAHPTSLVILPGFLIYSFVEMRKKNLRNFLFLVAVLLIVLFFAGAVNYIRFHSFTEFGYGPYYGGLAVHTKTG